MTQVTVLDAAATRLLALYMDELLQSLMPPVHPIVDERQTQAPIGHARAAVPGLCEAPDEATWIWSDLRLGHKPSSGPSSGRRATRRGQQHGSGEVDDSDGGERRDLTLRHGRVPSPRRAADHWLRTTILAPNLPMRSSKC